MTGLVLGGEVPFYHFCFIADSGSLLHPLLSWVQVSFLRTLYAKVLAENYPRTDIAVPRLDSGAKSGINR